MRNLIKNSKKTVLRSAMFGFLFAALGATAFAASNNEECAAEISSAEQMMLTANITNDQLTSIDSDLQAANALCGSGDFAGASAKIKASLDVMKATAK